MALSIATDSGMRARIVSRCVCCRWDVDAVYHPAAPLLASGLTQGQVATRFGTFLPDIHSFDPAAFGLSVGEAAVMVSASQRLGVTCCMGVQQLYWVGAGKLRCYYRECWSMAHSGFNLTLPLGGSCAAHCV